MPVSTNPDPTLCRVFPSDELTAHLSEHLSRSPEGEARLRFLVLALCGEAGELANCIKKHWRGDAGDRREQVISELADCANYVRMLAMHLGVDLEAEMLRKVDRGRAAAEARRNAPSALPQALKTLGSRPARDARAASH